MEKSHKYLLPRTWKCDVLASFILALIVMDTYVLLQLIPDFLSFSFYPCK